MATRSRSDYLRAERLGRWAELLCRLALRLKGYRILASRIRLPAGEIDILALRGDVLAVVEVKARASLEEAVAAVRPADWTRIARAARQYVARRPKLAGHGIRYDLMAVTPGRWPAHSPDHWRPPG